QTQLSTIDDANVEGTTQAPVPAFGTEAPGQREVLAPDTPQGIVDSSGMEMVTHPPLSTLDYSMAFTTETERSNYLSGGLNFSGAYDSGVATTSAGHSTSDNSYSVRPALSWRQSTSRVLWSLSYTPGFTFYQHNSSLNQSDQAAGLESRFRLSPHVTLTLRD